MFKIVLNEGYGSFDLSNEAKELFLNKLGVKFYSKYNQYFKNELDYFITEDEYLRLSDKHKKYFLKRYKEKDYYFIVYNIERHNPILVDIVQKLGEEANGIFAKLTIVEINSNKYYIDICESEEILYIPESIEWIEINERINYEN